MFHLLICVVLLVCFVWGTLHSVRMVLWLVFSFFLLSDASVPTAITGWAEVFRFHLFVLSTPSASLVPLSQGDSLLARWQFSVFRF